MELCQAEQALTATRQALRKGATGKALQQLLDKRDRQLLQVLALQIAYADEQILDLRDKSKPPPPRL